MGRYREEVLFDALLSARAWQNLHDPAYIKNLNPEQYLELCKTAGASEEEAQQAATEWANLRLDKGLDK